jgi:hypothetical protein
MKLSPRLAHYQYVDSNTKIISVKFGGRDGITIQVLGLKYQNLRVENLNTL